MPLVPELGGTGRLQRWYSLGPGAQPVSQSKSKVVPLQLQEPGCQPPESYLLQLQVMS